jgi:hypothetical protein
VFLAAFIPLSFRGADVTRNLLFDLNTKECRSLALLGMTTTDIRMTRIDIGMRATEIG